MSPADDAATTAWTKAPFIPLPQKAPDVSVELRADGSYLLRSDHPPGRGPRSIAHLLAQRAAEHPDRPYILQREPGHGPWRGATYGEAAKSAESIAQWLLDRGLTEADSVMVLSGNSVEHALVMLGCYTAGVPVAPVSPAYSQASSDLGKLKHCFAVVAPKVVFAQSGPAFARAIDTLRQLDPAIEVVTVDGGGAIPLSELLATPPTAAVDFARERLRPSSVAKYLFTSGSTGMPKGVPQTIAMFVDFIAGLEGLRTEPRDPDEAPEVLEWMPWSHIAAGNVMFHKIIWDGATLYIDDGRPAPGLFETTLKNLAERRQSMFASVPVGFGMVVEALEQDPALRKVFFEPVRSMLYGGATLSEDVHQRMQALAVAETGNRIPVITMYGATETMPITIVHWAADRVGLLGLPLPGVTLELVPTGGKLDVRVKGATIMTGYHKDPEKTAAAFDEEGFYKLGDACRFVDPQDPAQGLVFDGRVTEDFKLDSGTWVSVGTLRPDIVTACSPYVFDVVVTGQDKPFIGALIWPAPAMLAGLGDNPLEKLTTLLAEQLAAFNRTAGGGSRRVSRFLLMTEPPSIDAGEVTDKGYINQRATLDRRQALVAALHAEPPGPGVVVVPR